MRLNRKQKSHKYTNYGSRDGTILPSEIGKPLIAMSTSAPGIGRHNTPGLTCHLMENVLIDAYHPGSLVICVNVTACFYDMILNMLNGERSQ
jgi:hypothetical protein